MKGHVMFKKSQKAIALDAAIANVLSWMENADPTTPEYAQTISKLEKLYALRGSKKSVSPDTLAIVLGNLAGIIMILNHERAHVVVSKALGFVMKLK
jgi:hypothetical protein